MTIYDFKLKIKDAQERLNSREFYTILLILFVGFGSFGLGRLSKLQESKTPIRIEQASAAVLSLNPTLIPKGGTGKVVESPLTNGVLSSQDAGAVSPGGQLVASKGGAKYHFPWCSGAQRIAEANKIWFSSVEDARKAGYTPASNCKGLK